MNKSSIALAILAGVATTSSASAEPSKEQVRYADLNLNSQEGIDALDGRLRVAVRRACGRAPAELPLAMKVRACRLAARKQAEVQRVAAIDKARRSLFATR